jgi:glycerol-3-phosphate O-acyltransferase
VGAPKLGILSYMISAYEPGRSRDIVFVPVALNYDRVLEDRVLVAAGKSGQRKFRLRWRTAIRYLVQHFWQRLTGRFLRFGHAAVSFGAPVSLAQVVDRGGVARAEDVGEELMQRIRAIVPVLPVPLVAACLLQAEGPMSREALHAEAARAVHRMRAAGAQVELMNGELAREVDLAVNHLLMRRVLAETPRGIAVNEAERPLVEYYANSISHLQTGEKRG